MKTKQLASEAQGLLRDRVETTRLLGRDKALVLHGGGNTSVKVSRRDIFGNAEEILYVKGSGWDLETIEEAGFAPVRLDHLRRLAELKVLPDPVMVNEMVTHMSDASAPVPSVEAILHAIIPFRFVDHTHADAIIAITNTPSGEERIREIYGMRVIVIPYVMPGFELARICAEYLEAELNPDVIGMILLNHGIVSFGDTAEESYGRMLDMVGMANAYLEKWRKPRTERPLMAQTEGDSLELAALRDAISRRVGSPCLLMRDSSSRVMEFVLRPDLAEIAGRGPATPDHVIRTKRLPLIGRDVEGYVAQYKAYFLENEPLSKERKVMLDPAPRVVLDRSLGLCAVGRSAKEAGIVAEIYRHTVDIIEDAEDLERYEALPAKDIFDVEYWDLEQAKLRKTGTPPVFSGEIALITGAASGIGRACVDALLGRGAAVVGLDINPSIVTLCNRSDFLGIVCDITDEDEVGAAFREALNRFGGLDMMVLNAGIFPGGCRIADLTLAEWRKVGAVNLDANLLLLKKAHPFLRLAFRGGRVVVIGSKNVPAPGPGAAAYSASKAALNQLARVAALEWGEDGIRVNSVHPNAVFDTGIWTDEVLAARARHYGLSVEEYKKNNILKTEVSSRDVAELVAEMCGPRFSKTTGSQVPIDGGNDRVI